MFLKEKAKVFRSKPILTVDSKCLLYVQQREYAATTPTDSEFLLVFLLFFKHMSHLNDYFNRMVITW